MGIPMGWFIRETPTNMDDLGYLYFRKPYRSISSLIYPTCPLEACFIPNGSLRGTHHEDDSDPKWQY